MKTVYYLTAEARAAMNAYAEWTVKLTRAKCRQGSIPIHVAKKRQREARAALLEQLAYRVDIQITGHAHEPRGSHSMSNELKGFP